MATVGWILLGLLAVLILALCIPLRFMARYRTGEPVEAWLGWLFLRFDLTAAGGEGEKQPPEPAPKKQKKEKPRAEKPPLEFSRLLGMILDLLSSVKGGAGMLIRNFRLYKIVLRLVVAGEDAADTAIKYGKVNTAVYSAYAVAQQFLNLARPEISIRPDFTSEKGGVDFEARGRMTPIVAVGAAIRIGAAFLVKTIKRRNENKQASPQGPDAPAT